MKHTISTTAAKGSFDLSDVTPPEDTLDDVLAIAAEVLAEYGEDQTRTRIRRLAEWIVMNVGGEPHQTEVAGKGAERYKVHEHAYPLVRVGGIFGVERTTEQISGPAKSPDGTCVVAFAVGTEAARAFAVAMLRSCERD